MYRCLPAAAFSAARQVPRSCAGVRFQSDCPGIRYELLPGDYEEIEQWIFNGLVDCGFLRLPAKTEYDTVSPGKDEYMAILPENHPLTQKDVLSQHDLDDQPFMLLEHGGKTEVSGLLEKYHVKRIYVSLPGMTMPYYQW
ncbi:MAG: LysR family transcriptional regulator substrate-binding protein [Synergistes sp.]|nr:LysR family transcriptional regulator substrate-binding protein [Synergistes sp.]